VFQVGNELSKGDVLSDYVSCGPPKGSGLHRYVYLVAKQPGKLDFKDVPRLTNKSGNGRGNFHAREFLKKWNLQLAGANYFQAKWDEHVPIMYKQLGF